MDQRPVEIRPGSEDWKKYRVRAANDLYWFNEHIRDLKEPVSMTHRAHLPMCLFVERKTGIPAIDEAPVQLIQLPRGRGKTSLITQGYPLQQLLKNPEWTCGIANEKAENAEAMLGAIKLEFESNELIQALFPERIPDFRSDWKASRITIRRKTKNPMDPSILATGVGGTTTGVHVDMWINDDIISQNAAENARAGLYTEIDKVNRWCKRQPPMLKDHTNGRRLFIGTPWWVGDTYEWLIEDFYGKDEVRREFVWTLKLPDGSVRHMDVFRQGDIAVFKDPAIDKNGRPVHPEVLDTEDLDKHRKKDPIFFQGQYMLNPSGGEAAEFRIDDLKEFAWESPYQIRFRDLDGKIQYTRTRDLQTVVSVDPAISRSDTSARSAVIVTGTDGRHIFLLEAVAKRIQATELAHLVLEMYKKYQPYRIVPEYVGYQEALKDIMELLAREQSLALPLPIHEFQPGSKTRKEVRILGLEPYFSKGLFYWNPRTQYQFEEEFVNFPHFKFRDLLDALSFQRETWERLFAMSDFGSVHSGAVSEARRSRIERIREHMASR